jgi:tRNA-modifying protein YgfZ
MTLYADVSGRSALSMTGSDCLDFLQRISTNDVAQLKPGESGQTILTNEKGKIVDVVVVYRNSVDMLSLLGQTLAPGSLVSWIEKYVIMENIRVEDVTSVTRQYIVYSNEVLDQVVLKQSLPSECITSPELMAGSNVLRVACQFEMAETVESRLKGADFSLATQEDYNDFRIRRGIPASGSELTAQYNPLESGLAPLISWTKGCYIGQEVIARLDTYKKVQRRLVRMVLSEGPSDMPTAFFKGETEAGTITSVTGTASDGSCDGLGFLKLAGSTEGGDLFFLKGQKKIPVGIQGSD